MATVGVLFLAVKRSFGAVAATIAAVVMALTPAAVLIFRFNNPDALLTLLLVLSAWALLRSLEHGSYRWMALAAACVGLAFLTKYLQAYLVLPGYALVFGFSANTTLRRRIVGLGLALATVLVTSGWWVAIVRDAPGRQQAVHRRQHDRIAARPDLRLRRPRPDLRRQRPGRGRRRRRRVQRRRRPAAALQRPDVRPDRVVHPAVDRLPGRRACTGDAGPNGPTAPLPATCCGAAGSS